jgi:hypothetical protein
VDSMEALTMEITLQKILEQCIIEEIAMEYLMGIDKII